MTERDEPVAYALYDRESDEIMAVDLPENIAPHDRRDWRVVPLYDHPACEAQPTPEPSALAKVREYADRIGSDRIGTGAYADDDSEWAQGYRQAERYHFHRMAALLDDQIEVTGMNA